MGSHQNELCPREKKNPLKYILIKVNYILHMSVSANRLHLRLMMVESRGERWKRGGRGGGKKTHSWAKSPGSSGFAAPNFGQVTSPL